ncbi:MAG: glycosyltransferase involved in cell wall biosynthesis [Chlamydiales bacterium]
MGPATPELPPSMRTTHAPSPSAPIQISVVVPVFNEEESLGPLQGEIAEHVGGMGVPWEVLYVDDRSSDSSLDVLLKLREDCPSVRIVRFRRNYGQTAAMAAGFEHARGRVVVTLDADLQNDPADIPRLVAELDKGFDIVTGWRKDRQDGLWLRRVPSRMANRAIGWFTGTRVHDTGCTLKAFRREVVQNLPIYADQHRFLPVLAASTGARLSEVVVNHRARIYGESKYGLGRALRVLVDLLGLKMISSFSRRPLQYFALLSAPFALISLVFLASGVRDQTLETHRTFWGHAILVTSVPLLMACVYFLLLGLLAELVVKASGMHSRRFFRPLVRD